MNTYRNGGTDHDLIHARGQAPRYAFDEQWWVVRPQ
jgi:hypothetical protein